MMRSIHRCCCRKSLSPLRHTLHRCPGPQQVRVAFSTMLRQRQCSVSVWPNCRQTSLQVPSIVLLFLVTACLPAIVNSSSICTTVWNLIWEWLNLSPNLHELLMMHFIYIRDTMILILFYTDSATSRSGMTAWSAGPTMFRWMQVLMNGSFRRPHYWTTHRVGWCMGCVSFPWLCG